jgi:hypothetical protein
MVDIFKTIFGIDISLGSVCNLHEKVSRALEPSYEDIKKALPQQSVVNVDETGWRSMGRSMWLWIFVAPSLAFFTLLPSREHVRASSATLDPLFRPLLSLRELPQGTAAGLLGPYHPRDQGNPPCVP